MVKSSVFFAALVKVVYEGSLPVRIRLHLDSLSVEFCKLLEDLHDAGNLVLVLPTRHHLDDGLFFDPVKEIYVVDMELNSSLNVQEFVQELTIVVNEFYILLPDQQPGEGSRILSGKVICSKGGFLFTTENTRGKQVVRGEVVIRLHDKGAENFIIDASQHYLV